MEIGKFIPLIIEICISLPSPDINQKNYKGFPKHEKIYTSAVHIIDIF